MIQIYTDGACIVQTREGGSAFIVVKNEEVVYKRLFSFSSTTNNFCELFAVLESIRYTIDNNISECQIFSDSKYTVDGINNWMDKWRVNDWRGYSGHRIKNLDIWLNICILWDVCRSMSNISIHYVKGHDSSMYNKIADKLAKEAIKNIS